MECTYLQLLDKKKQETRLSLCNYLVWRYRDWRWCTVQAWNHWL